MEKVFTKGQEMDIFLKETGLKISFKGLLKCIDMEELQLK